MNRTPKRSLKRATKIAERDWIHPIPCTRCDTGELIWLVQSRSNPSCYYLLTGSSGIVHCPFPQAQHREICAHAAVVRLTLEADPQCTSVAPPLPDQSPSLRAPRHQHHSVSQREQEHRQRADAERRERALLWTDDRPFSIWK